MTVFAAPIDVKNAAILSMGAKPLMSETAANPEARILAARYEPLVKTMLTKHAWTWAMKRELMAVSGETPDGQYLYVLPSDLLTLRYITYEGRIVEFREYDEGKIVFPVTGIDLYAHYNWRVPESSWPADFADAVVRFLTAALVAALKGDMNEASAIEGRGDQLMRQAMARDKRTMRGRGHNEYPRIVSVYRGYRRHGPPA